MCRVAFDDVICRGLPEQVALLEAQIEVKEGLLEDPELTPVQRGQIRQQIRQLRDQLAAVREQIEECRTAPLTIVGVELTQGTQYFRLNGRGSGFAADNSVPLVSQKQMMVRVYAARKPSSPPSGPNPGQPPPLPLPLSGRIHYLHVGEPESRRKTIKPLIGINAKTAAGLDRGEFRDSLNFVIPAIDCQGTLRLQIEVFDDPPVNDPTFAAAALLHRTATVLAAFHPVPAFRLYPVLIHYTGGGMNIAAPSGFDFAQVLGYTVLTYPIGRLQLGDCVEYEFDGDLTFPGPGCGRGWSDLLDRLDDMRIGGDPEGIYVALLPERTPSQGGVQGCGSSRGVAAVLLSSVIRATAMAQEIGHGLDRWHAPCGGPANPDPDYPKYDAYFDGSIGEYGVSLESFHIFSPTNVADFMSYCFANPPWISPHTFIGIRDAMVQRWGTSSLATLREPEEELLHLRFDVHLDVVTMGRSYHRPGVLTQMPGVPTSIVVELVGEDDEVLAWHRCLLRNPLQNPTDPWLTFSETLVWVRKTRRIVVKRDDTVLHTLEVEDLAPALGALSPVFDAASGTLSWSMPHIASAAGLHQIEFSHDDGRTWRTLAHSRGNHYQVDPRSLPGGEHCRFRVLTTSGIRSASAETAPFPIPVKRRRAQILKPQPGQHFRADEPVVLVGGGFAAGRGLSDPADTTWTSDVDGPVGSGHLLTATLSPGRHTLTLTVPDGMDSEATAQTSVEIAAETRE
jgi:hypothetical protein